MRIRVGNSRTFFDSQMSDTLDRGFRVRLEDSSKWGLMLKIEMQAC